MSWFTLLICLATLLLQTHGAPAFHEHHSSGYDRHAERCHPLMAAAGLTKRFPGAVAHGIHSITLEDIRHYFKHDATEENHVPTLNYDLRSNKTVLPHAKLYGYDTTFSTVSMRIMDQVLRDMDKKDWYLTNYNTLEKLAHTAHMNEVWAKAKVHYDSISLLEPSGQLCRCLTDVQNNGIMKMLPFMSLKIRFPGITSGMHLQLENGQADWSGNIYHYAFFNDWSNELKNFDFSGEHVKERAAKKLVDGDKGMKARLVNEEAWKFWKHGMKSRNKHDDYELAMFLYCTLNQ